MTFVVRTKTQRATGGDIVRSVRHEKAEISVGRGTDCDVQIADLAVMLHQLRLIRSGAIVRVIAEEGAPFEIDGGFVENALVTPGDSIAIVIGSHQLTIGGNAEAAGDILVEVDRIAPVLDASSKDETREFSIRHVAPPKRATAWLFALLILAIGLAWPIASFVRGPAPDQKIRADQLWLSGSLATAHANLKGDCQACHVKAFVSVEDSTCKSCHATAHDHADALKMLRAHPDLGFTDRARMAVGGVFGLAPDRCSSCHREHEGPKMARASTPCADCHAGLKARLPGTRLADVPSFAGHPEFHATLGGKRVSMALRPRDDPGLIFPHNLHLAAAGGVARMAQTLGKGAALTCESCHKPGARGVGYLPIEMERDCGACHALGGLPHGDVKRAVRTLLNGGPVSAPASTTRRRPGEIASSPRAAPRAMQSARAWFQPGGTCADCHNFLAPPHPGWLPRVAPVRLQQRFLPLGGFNHAEHKFSPCADCHATTLSSSSADVMLPSIQRCRDCHAQPKSAHPASGDCAECHGFHEPTATPALRMYSATGIHWPGKSPKT